MYTYQPDSSEDVQEARLTDFEDQVEHAKLHPRHLVDVEAAVDPLLLKHKKHNEQKNITPSGVK